MIKHSGLRFWVTLYFILRRLSCGSGLRLAQGQPRGSVGVLTVYRVRQKVSP